jgi:hypothetical protein
LQIRHRDQEQRSIFNPWNLATGNAIVDMKLAGTGLHPQLQGQVRLEKFDATLPFSYPDDSARLPLFRSGRSPQSKD